MFSLDGFLVIYSVIDLSISVSKTLFTGLLNWSTLSRQCWIMYEYE